MKIESQQIEDHQVKLIVETAPEPLEEAKQQAARQLGRKTKIPGFRPGKAPYAVIVRHFGEKAVLDEAIEILINEIYPKVLKEIDIAPYGPGELEKVVKIDPPTFEFIVPLKPTVELGDFSSVRLPYEIKKVDKVDIDNVLEDLRKRHAVVEPAMRPAQIGDIVYVKLSGALVGDKSDENSLLKDKRLPIMIAEEEEDNLGYPYPGFSKELIGLSAGDEKVIQHDFSQDFYVESLRGVQAEYHVLVEDVKSRTLPELDDEFAQSLGEYSSINDLINKISERLQKQAEETYNKEYEEKVIEEIINASMVKYPPQMLKREIENVLNQLKEQLANQKLDIELYLKSRQINMEQLKEEAKSVAQARLLRMLTLFELSEAMGIKVSPEEVQDETTRTIDEISHLIPKKMPKVAEEQIVSNLVGNIMMDMLIKRTMNKIREIASGQSVEIVEK